MKYIRKDNTTNQFLYLFVVAIGIELIYLGFSKLFWLWNILTFPIGLILIISGYKNYKRATHDIQSLEFTDNKLRLSFLNGQEKDVDYNKLRYALLVKKFYKPIRSIEFIESGKLGIRRGKRIGVINFDKWEKDIEPIARHLIKNKFNRRKWQFGWSFGDFLLIFSILLGMSEGIAESYIDGLDLNFSQATGNIGEIISDQRDKSIEESIEAEKKYDNKNKK